MFSRYILGLTLLLLLLPLHALASLDPTAIKVDLQNNSSLQISAWTIKDKNSQWIATTGLKRTKISVSDNKILFIAPFINPKQIKAGKILCAEFANSVLKPKDKNESKKIKSLIRKSTTRHQIQFLKMNNKKFSVTPKLIGSVVSLHCSINSI